jgi:hypothetical protein
MLVKTDLACTIAFYSVQISFGMHSNDLYDDNPSGDPCDDLRDDPYMILQPFLDHRIHLPKFHRFTKLKTEHADMMQLVLIPETLRNVSIMEKRLARECCTSSFPTFL